jgi:hypothetical protein
MPLPALRSLAVALALAAGLSCGPALAQQPSPQPAAPAKPYKQVAVSLPAPFVDPSLDSFRKQLADLAQRKNRAALAALIVPRGFFWERETGNGADEKKSGLENFAAAIGLDARDGSGWEALADYAAESSASKVGDRQDMVCSPASPVFDDNAFVELLKATDTDASQWGYPLKDGIEARDSAKPDGKLVEKLGLFFVRVLMDETPPAQPDQPESAEPILKVVTPSGKAAFILAETLAPLGIDQLCYVKRDGGWKIMGYVGEGAAQ